MANIADNLKRLLGTTGHNIQEILENTDSLGGSGASIPSIEFVLDDEDNASLGEVKGIEDVVTYVGPCLVTLTGISGGNRYMIGQMPTSAMFTTNSPSDNMPHGYYYIIIPNHQEIRIYLFDVAEDVAEDGAVNYKTKSILMQEGF